MPNYSFEARNNYGDIETFAPYVSKRDAHAAQDRLGKSGYTDFSAITEEPEDREPMLAASIDCLPPIPVTREMREDWIQPPHLPEIPVTDEQEPESVDLIASGYDWTCPNCGLCQNVIEYGEKVTCRDCEHTYTANSPEHAYD